MSDIYAVYWKNGTKGHLNAILVLQCTPLIISEIDLAFYVNVLQLRVCIIVMKDH